MSSTSCCPPFPSPSNEGRGVALVDRRDPVGEPAAAAGAAVRDRLDPAVDRRGVTGVGTLQPVWPRLPTGAWPGARVLRRRGPAYARIDERQAIAVGVGRSRGHRAGREAPVPAHAHLPIAYFGSPVADDAAFGALV